MLAIPDSLHILLLQILQHGALKVCFTPHYPGLDISISGCPVESVCALKSSLDAWFMGVNMRENLVDQDFLFAHSAKMSITLESDELGDFIVANVSFDVIEESDSVKSELQDIIPELNGLDFIFEDDEFSSIVYQEVESVHDILLELCQSLGYSYIEVDGGWVRKLTRKGMYTLGSDERCSK